MQNWQHEGRRFAGTGLCQAQYVAAFEDCGNSLLLNRGRRGVTHRLYAVDDALINIKLFEIQKRILLDSIEPSRILSPLLNLEIC